MAGNTMGARGQDPEHDLGSARDRLGPRDAADALNVATVHLPGAARTERREGDPAAAILDAAAKREVDEIVLVAAGVGEVGSTTRSVLAAADRPVVVVHPT